MLRHGYVSVAVILACVYLLAPFPTLHASPASVEMHKNFPNVSNCVTCHADPHQGQMSVDCQTCHNTDMWSQINSAFIHSGEFPLTGQHKTVSCEQCHLNGQFKSTPRDCQICHWQRSKDDPYKTKLGMDCARCHTTRGWAPANWNHTQETGFALAGAHRAIACDQCHKDLRFKGASAACISCHEADFNGATDPNHKSAGYSRDCSICHTADSWTTSVFSHDTTGFALTGGHAGLDCSQCHTNGVYTGLSPDCFSCHNDDYNKTDNPHHGPAGFSTDCTQCHSTTTWSTGQYDHDITGYPLTGGHQAAACSDCHSNGIYSGTPRDCFACHTDDYNATTDPNHTTSGYGTDCAVCHTTSTWKSGSFNHPSYDLTGAHVGLDCSVCHENGQYAGTPRECEGCHMNSYNDSNDPHHAAAGFDTRCETCHDTSTWTTGQFDHHSTGYPLTGKHSSAGCRDCHSSGVYSGLNTACYSCHEDDYKNATNPNHAAAGLPSNCTTCHDTSGWENDFFNHTTTGYTLTGAHVVLDCIDCHINNQFKGTSRDCIACHQDDYNNAPNHQGYPTDCEQCHTTNSWNSTMFKQPLKNVPHIRRQQ